MSEIAQDRDVFDEAEPVTAPASDPDEMRHREAAIVHGRPTAIFQHNGKTLEIWPKVQNQFYKLDLLAHEYVEALANYDRRLYPPRWRRWIRKAWPFSSFARITKRRAVDRIEGAKYALIRMIFEDVREDRRSDLSYEDFLTMPHDLVVNVLRAHRLANDVSDILRELVPDFEAKKNADPQGTEALATTRNGLRT